VAETEALQAQAARLDSVLVTTAKDAVRLAPAFRARVWVAGVALAWNDEAALDRLLCATVDKDARRDAQPPKFTPA
jgi:tetraacyldisaccharide 4'-kinase